MRKGRTSSIPGSPFQHEADSQEWNSNHNEKCDPGGESDDGAIRLLYGNRESMNDASRAVLEWVP